MTHDKTCRCEKCMGPAPVKTDLDEAIELLIPIVTEGKRIGEESGEDYCKGTYMHAVETIIQFAQECQKLKIGYDYLEDENNQLHAEVSRLKKQQPERRSVSKMLLGKDHPYADGWNECLRTLATHKSGLIITDEGE